MTIASRQPLNGVELTVKPFGTIAQERKCIRTKYRALLYARQRRLRRLLQKESLDPTTHNGEGRSSLRPRLGAA